MYTSGDGVDYVHTSGLVFWRLSMDYVYTRTCGDGNSSMQSLVYQNISTTLVKSVVWVLAPLFRHLCYNNHALTIFLMLIADGSTFPVGLNNINNIMPSLIQKNSMIYVAGYG